MRLYYSPGTCSLAPHIVIREAGLDVALERVDLRQHRTASGRNYLEVNPSGAVPALELHSGEFLTENAVLLQYLAQLAPNAGLAPAGGGMEHWRLLELLNFIATELHKGFSQLFAKPPQEWREKAIEKIKSRFALLTLKLGAKPYLTGDRFSIADAYAFVMLTWAPKFEITLPEELRLYAERIKQRPAVRRALEEEGLPIS
jgi:glutathione S-transferase